MMKKKVLYLLCLLATMPLTAFAETCRVDTLLGYLNDGGKSDHVMIFAHRGNWRNSAENSIQAFKECIDEGIDGIEIDLQMSKDSVLVIMHDDTLDRTTTGKGKISDYTLAELKELKLLTPIGVETRLTIPTFEELLILAKGKALIQVDKWKPFYRQVAELARKHDCERQIIIRTTDKKEAFTRMFGNTFDNVIVMPVLVCKNDSVDNDKLDDFLANYNTPAISLSFTRDDFKVLERTGEIKKSGYRIWFNSLWNTFNGGHDDELALTDTENSYGWLLKAGADIIFSDNPMLLNKYLKSINRR